MRVNGRRRFLETLGGVGSASLAGCLYMTGPERSSTSTPEQAATATPNDFDYKDFFGTSITVDEDTVVVGAPFDDDPNGKKSGSAHVFDRSRDGWQLTATLVPDDGDDEDKFGTAVALTGDTVLVGADTDEDPNGAYAGSVYVFERDADGWEQTSKFAADDGDSYDWFGGAVAVSDGTAIVGARNDDDPNGDEGGSAYVFERRGDEWNQVAKLADADGDSEDQFGSPIELVDDIAMIGSYDGDPDRTDAGSVYVFERVDGEWVQTGKLSPEDSEAYDYFGDSIAIAGDTALIGASQHRDSADENAGATYVFERRDDEWTTTDKLFADDGDRRDWFGDSIGVADSTAIIGADGDEDPNGDEAGSAYVFERGAQGWVQTDKLTASDGDARDNFGGSIAVAGATAFIGARGDEDPNGNGNGSGSVYVFERSGGRWRQTDKLHQRE